MIKMGAPNKLTSQNNFSKLVIIDSIDPRNIQASAAFWVSQTCWGVLGFLTCRASWGFGV